MPHSLAVWAPAPQSATRRLAASIESKPDESGSLGATYSWTGSGSAYRPEPGELRFDMFDAEYTHDGDRCTFETLVRRFGLERDASLRSIAEIVHDIDVKDAKFARPEASGVEQILSGIAKNTPSDAERLARGGALFASLHESFRDRTSRPASRSDRSATAERRNAKRRANARRR